MARTAHHINVVVNGKVVDTLVLIDKGGNHATISNKNHILFEGYILEAYKIWENKINDWKVLSNAGFVTLETIK